MLSSALARAAQETLGASRINDTFGMTEILPVSGRVCNQGHLHPDINMGYIEVIDLETGQPAAPGTLGTLVITPFYPYRECMPVFRYDTRDVVRCLPDEPLTCDLSAVPAVSRILGKAEHLFPVNGQTVTLRDLVEAYEAMPCQPWPARFHARIINNQLELVVPEDVLSLLGTNDIERRFYASGIELHVSNTVVRADEAQQLRPLRTDLLETTFAARRD